MHLAVLIIFTNYAKIMLVSENYAVCHRNQYAIKILRKIKITSSSTLTILTLMNLLHIVHLPVLQSLASQIPISTPRKAK